tara:strand:+ start:486 stop:707 length:222 start_codon:yes stop_codon:yes gene_type:complete
MEIKKDNKPTAKPILKSKGFALYQNGELWKMGKHGYCVGYVSKICKSSMKIAISNHKEEMELELKSLQIEFGF